MLDLILSYLHTETPRVITNWKRYVSIVKLRSEIYRSRYLQSGFLHSQGSDMLITILKDASVEQARKMPSDISRYTLFERTAVQYRTLFDSVYTPRLKTGYFVEDASIPEVIMNVARESPLMSLPMDRPADAWASIRPMHIVHHDAKEHNINLIKMKIPFSYRTPSRMVYSLDVPILLLRYVKYLEDMDLYGVEGSPEDYLQTCVFSGWFDDLTRIWLFNILVAIMTDTFDSSEWKSDDMIAPSGMLGQLRSDIGIIRSNLLKNTIGVNGICSTEWFGNSSVLDWFLYVQRNLTMPTLRQYKALQFTFTFPFAKFVLSILQRTRRQQDIGTLGKSLLFTLRQYKSMNIVSNLQQPYLQSQVAGELKEALKMAEDLSIL